MTRLGLNRHGINVRAVAAAAVIATLSLLGASSAPLVGQEADRPTAVLMGTVLDPRGAPVAAARVRLVDSELAAVTNVVGRFLFPEVDPGVWELEVSARGYDTSHVADVAVRAGEPTRIAVTLSRTAGSPRADQGVFTRTRTSRAPGSQSPGGARSRPMEEVEVEEIAVQRATLSRIRGSWMAARRSLSAPPPPAPSR
jgi:hypothetical protein